MVLVCLQQNNMLPHSRHAYFCAVHLSQDDGVEKLSSVIPPLNKLVLEATAKVKGRDGALRASRG